MNNEFTTEMSLSDLWQVIASGKWIIATITFAATILVAIAAFMTTPVYQGEVLIAARGEEEFGAGLGQLGNLASLAGVQLDSGGDQKVQAIAMLRSRSLAERFISELGLVEVLFADLWDAEAKKWMVDDPAEVPTMRKAVRKFTRDVRSIEEDPKTGLVTLAIRWNDPELVAAWANGFVDLLNSEMRQYAIAEAEESIEYLQKEADKTAVVELERVIYSLVEEQIQTIMLANVREDYAFEILDPAVVPEPDEKVWPKRSLMIIAGFMFGLVVGIFVVLIRNVRTLSEVAD